MQTQQSSSPFGTDPQNGVIQIWHQRSRHFRIVVHDRDIDSNSIKVSFFANSPNSLKFRWKLFTFTSVYFKDKDITSKIELSNSIQNQGCMLHTPKIVRQNMLGGLKLDLIIKGSNCVTWQRNDHVFSITFFNATDVAYLHEPDLVPFRGYQDQSQRDVPFETFSTQSTAASEDMPYGFPPTNSSQ